MTTETLSPTPVQRFVDNNGNPLVGGKLFTYIAGTTTKQSTFVDSAGITPNTNPVILDYRGEARLWIPPNVGFKYVLAPSTDTDPPTNPIWTVDQLVNSQLITLYGGVDVGSVNAYVINFTANFTSYTDGIIIYWVPANTNTGPSTINVNGLGVITILNQNGNPLTAGQIVVNGITAVFYKGGNFYLTSATGSIPQSGTFSAVVTGGSNPNLTCRYTINGSFVSIDIPYCAFTSTTVGFSLTGLPVILQPASQKILALGTMQNNSAAVFTAQAWPNGTSITFLLNGSTSGWTASGVKGIGVLSGIIQLGCTINYSLL